MYMGVHMPPTSSVKGRYDENCLLAYPKSNSANHSGLLLNLGLICRNCQPLLFVPLDTSLQSSI